VTEIPTKNKSLILVTKIATDIQRPQLRLKSETELDTDLEPPGTTPDFVTDFSDLISDRT